MFECPDRIKEFVKDRNKQKDCLALLNRVKLKYTSCSSSERGAFENYMYALVQLRCWAISNQKQTLWILNCSLQTWSSVGRWTSSGSPSGFWSLCCCCLSPPRTHWTTAWHYKQRSWCTRRRSTTTTGVGCASSAPATSRLTSAKVTACPRCPQASCNFPASKR